ncbi:MAG: hypothetical protein IT249_04960 [Chitinophagaceae bacterium]|nr:hypothetical protein [Chitinophagaceae bacterium]
MAKLVGEKQYSIISDYLGTPVEAYDETGKNVWCRELDCYGQVRKGDNDFVPFLYQGQYWDEETGLAYNRFRYYDVERGGYLSQDPVGLNGGVEFYSYVDNSNIKVDRFGLIDGIIYLRTNPFTGEEYIGQAVSPKQFKDRQSKHNRRLQKQTGNPNAKYDFAKLEENVKTQADLDKLEEDWIRAGDGPKRKGGTLENSRYEMNDADYKKGGGKLIRCN